MPQHRLRHFLYKMIYEDETITEINDGLRLIEKRDGLTFGTDAYLLSAYVRRQTRARLADLGSGTGIIPLLLLARSWTSPWPLVPPAPTTTPLVAL